MMGYDESEPTDEAALTAAETNFRDRLARYQQPIFAAPPPDLNQQIMAALQRGMAAPTPAYRPQRLWLAGGIAALAVLLLLLGGLALAEPSLSRPQLQAELPDLGLRGQVAALLLSITASLAMIGIAPPLILLVGSLLGLLAWQVLRRSSR